MTAPLRPMTLGEILDRTFEVYRKRFFAFAGLSAIPALAVILVNIANRFWWKIRPPELAHLFGTLNIGVPFYLLVFFHVSMILQLLLYPSITNLCTSEYLGKPSSFSLSLRAGFKDWRANVSISLAQMAFGLILPEVVCLALFAGAGALEAALKIDTTDLGGAFAPTFLIFMLAGIAGYFWMWSYAALSWAAFEGENLTAGAAVHRSFSLSRGRRRAIILSQLIPAAIWWAFILALGILTQFLYSGLRAEGLSIIIVFPAYLALGFVGQWAIDTLVCPIFPIIMTLFYYDQRVRKEGYDLEKMMEDAGLTVAASDGAMENGEEPATVAQNDAESGLNGANEEIPAEG